MGDWTRAVHSGQQVVNPGEWPVLLLARRCHLGSPHTRCRNAVTQGARGSCSPSARCPPRAQLLADDGRQSSPVPSDALAEEGERDARRRTSARCAEVLEVRRTFIVSRLSAVYLAAAYAQVVPRHRRRMSHTEVHEAPFAEATEKRAVGEGRGIRDV
jgi:hypothetical protein